MSKPNAILTTSLAIALTFFARVEGSALGPDTRAFNPTSLSHGVVLACVISLGRSDLSSRMLAILRSAGAAWVLGPLPIWLGNPPKRKKIEAQAWPTEPDTRLTTPDSTDRQSAKNLRATGKKT